MSGTPIEKGNGDRSCHAHTRRSVLSVMGGAGIFGIAGCIGDDGETQDESPPLGGLEFSETSEERGLRYEYLDLGKGGQAGSITNAGVYVGNIVDNGYEDLLLIGGETPQLFINTDGEYHDSELLPSLEAEVLGALFFDHNNKGADDLLLLLEESTPVFLRNEGGELVETDIGFDDTLERPAGAAAADYTGNGLLDVFIIQNGNWSKHRPKGSEAYEIDEDNGNPNVLYQNEGGQFSRVDDAGISGTRWSLATAFVDLTGNRKPDIYVANDFNTDILYRNRGDGTFDRTVMPNSHRNAMSATIADISGNGHLDVFVTNIYFDDILEEHMPTIKLNSAGNNLFINQGDGEFIDEAREYGVEKGGWGWAGLIEDFTNNGNKEIIHATSYLGVHHRIQSETRLSREEVENRYSFILYPSIFERRDNNEFTRVHPPDVGFEEIGSRGIVAIDSTQTGTLDLVIANSRGRYRLYESAEMDNNWLRVRVKGNEDITPIGSTVKVESESTTQYRVVHSGSDFLSQESRIQHFGLGEIDEVSVQINWPDGTGRTFESVETNQQVLVTPNGELSGEY